MNIISVLIGLLLPYIFYVSIMDWIAIVISTIFSINLIYYAASKENFTLDINVTNPFNDEMKIYNNSS